MKYVFSHFLGEFLDRETKSFNTLNFCFISTEKKDNSDNMWLYVITYRCLSGLLKRPKTTHKCSFKHYQLI